MQIRPLGTYREPCYPTHTILDEHPELLRLVPKRWRGNPVVLAALTGVCVLLSGCRHDVSAGPPKVAPIFLHGDGRGTFAGKVLNPPVILPEDEARQVIVEEAKRAGISFSGAARTVQGLPVPSGFNRQQRTKLVDLRLDGTDAKRNISFEYVSEADVGAWNTNRLWPLGTAQLIRKGLVSVKPAGTYAVFYDPSSRAEPIKDKRGHIDWKAMQTEYKAAAQEVARRELRNQVRDFIKWLKAQGVI